MPESIRDTIARVAKEEGIDPSYALAVAERESSFNPNASGTGSIKGLFQLTGKNRQAYGQADDASTEDQVRAFSRFTKGVQGEMRGALGRDPTPEELYLGHHIGGTRAANIAAGRYRDLAPSDVFTPREMQGNPHFARAASVGQLADSITSDIGRRRAKFGGGTTGGGNQPTDFAAFGQPAGPNSPSNGQGVVMTTTPSGRPGIDLLKEAMTKGPNAGQTPQAQMPPGVQASKLPPQPTAPAPSPIDALRDAMTKGQGRFGQPPAASAPAQQPQRTSTRSVPTGGDALDFAQFGEPMSKISPTKVADKIDTGDDRSGLDRNFERNRAWTKPGSDQFNTDLGDREQSFRGWVKDNKVPFNPDSTGPQDYDMRGFWSGLQSGDEHAKSAVNPNDKKLHYPDYWKTPYHETFSGESQWAAPNAPKWNDKDQLIGPDGSVLFDERAKNAPVGPMSDARPGQEIDIAALTDGLKQPAPDSGFGDSVRRRVRDNDMPMPRQDIDPTPPPVDILQQPQGIA